LGSEKWGTGPTAVVLKQDGPWTYGALANHLWSFVGDSGRSDVNATFIQPFASYITPSKTTFTVNSEMTYDWTNEQWNVPLNLIVSQLMKIGDHPVQLFAGARYYLDAPNGGPEWGLRERTATQGLFKLGARTLGHIKLQLLLGHGDLCLFELGQATPYPWDLSLTRK
jgi:hypothetical protein